jgi:hypothetical protein
LEWYWDLYLKIRFLQQLLKLKIEYCNHGKKSATEVTLDVICREIKELKEGQKELRADINRGKGAIWLLLVISGMVVGFLGYFKN